MKVGWRHLLAGVIVIAGDAVFAGRLLFADRIRESHTASTIHQMGDAVTAGDAIVNADGSIALLRDVSIDWNSTEIREGRLLDGWKRGVIVRKNGSTLTFCSAAADGIFETADDVSAVHSVARGLE